MLKAGRNKTNGNYRTIEGSHILCIEKGSDVMSVAQLFDYCLFDNGLF